MTRGRFKNYNSLSYRLLWLECCEVPIAWTKHVIIGWRNAFSNHLFYFIWRTPSLCKTLFIGKTNDWAGMLLYYYNRFGQSTLVIFFQPEGHVCCIHSELRLSMLWGNETKTSNLTRTVAVSFLLMLTFTTAQNLHWS